jgi:tripartite-type tricarboxylate transporter receptor subunit TctC
LKKLIKIVISSFLIISSSSYASEYPNRPIRWIVSYAPGGTADIIARIIAQPLGTVLGQSIIVENRPGAGNNIGTEFVIKSPPDGYTMLFVNPANGINTTLYKNLPFDFVRDITPVVGIIRTPNVMVVPANFPANTISEFITYCKNNNNKINMASAGSGTSPHMSGELFMSMTGCQMTHVPYKGAGPATVDLLAGHVQVMFDNLPSASGNIKAGKLKALGVTSATRDLNFPTVPTIREVVSGYEITAWYGIGMPAGTPPEIVNRMNVAVNQVMRDPKIRERLADLGGVSIAGTVGDFRKVVVTETKKWGEIVKFSGATVD